MATTSPVSETVAYKVRGRTYLENDPEGAIANYPVCVVGEGGLHNKIKGLLVWAFCLRLSTKLNNWVTFSIYERI